MKNLSYALPVFLFLSFSCKGSVDIEVASDSSLVVDQGQVDLTSSIDMAKDIIGKDTAPELDINRDLSERDLRPDIIISEPNLQIVPWQGHKGAASFTFDDASSTHLDAAIPVLDSHGVRGTFFLVCVEAKRREADWKAVGTKGVHELANHSERHARPAELSNDDDIAGCHTYIQDTLGAEVNTFAYPYGIVGDPYLSYSEDNYIAARSTIGGSVKIDEEPVWAEVPTDAVGVRFGPLSDTIASLDLARVEEHWINFVYHGINDAGDLSTPRSELDTAVAKAVSLDLWVDTFARVATYLAVTQAIDISNPTIDSSSGQWTWTWTVPPGAESTVRLHIVIEGGSLWQNENKLPINDVLNVYEVDPRVGELTWRGY